MPNETPHSLIVHDVQRLFEEAKLLQHNGSNATAVFLSIAAIEESGKSLIQCDPNRMLPKKGKSDHSAKQKIIGEKFDQLCLFEALKQEVDRLESYLKANGTVESISEFLEMPEEDRLQFVHAMVLKDPSYLKKLIQQAQGPEEHSINFSRDVNRNKVTEKREQALYVHIKDGKLQPSPFDITVEEADQWLERAEFAVHIAELSLHKMNEP